MTTCPGWRSWCFGVAFVLGAASIANASVPAPITAGTLSVSPGQQMQPKPTKPHKPAVQQPAPRDQTAASAAQFSPAGGSWGGPRLDDIVIENTTDPVTTGNRATVEVRIAARTISDLSATDTEAIANRPTLMIDGKPVAASFVMPPKAVRTTAIFLSVYAAYSYDPETIGGMSLLDALLGSTHTLYLVDEQTGRSSNPRLVKFYAPVWERVLLGLGALALGAGAAGLSFYFWRVLYRHFWRLWNRRHAKVAGTAAGTEGMPASVEFHFEPRLIPKPAVPDVLINALRDKQAVLVLGAGAMAQAGFPTGQEMLALLLRRLSRDLPPEIVKALSSSGGGEVNGGYRIGGFGRAMDVVLSAVPRERVIAEVKSILSDVKPQRGILEQLSRLPWQSVLSLNWDQYAEDAFGINPKSDWQRFSLDNTSNLPGAIRHGDRCYLRPLGDLERPPSLSLSIEEFRRNLVRAPDFQRGLGLLLQSQIFFFVGISADTIDQFLQAAAPEVRVGTPRHFALVEDGPQNGLWESTLSRFGVQIIPYSPHDDYQEVRDFVADLSQAYRAGPQASAARRIGRTLSAQKVKAITLRNIGPFDNLELKFDAEPLADTKATPWTVIFGGNGCGKSSILRAIGLVLAGNDSGGFAAASRLLKMDQAVGEVTLQLGNDTLRTMLYRDRNTVKVESVQVTPVQAGIALVLGFPALRGAPSPNPVGLAALEARYPEPVDLLPLVNGDVDRRMGNLKQWIINVLDQSAKNNPRAAATRKLLDSIITEIVPGDVLALAPLDETYRIRVLTNAGPVPFEDLSQGMSSIFNWLGVLVQRLCDIYPDSPAPEKESAIVMVDEIDAHLHPDWQRRLVELTRKYFPNVQVLATSHSPLLAGALHKNEICVMERDPSTSRVAPLPFSMETYGMRSDRILTSAVFGLATDRNPEAERIIAGYFRLFQKLSRTPDEEAEMARLGDELSRLGYGAPAPASRTMNLSASDVDVLKKHFAAEQASEAAS